MSFGDLIAWQAQQKRRVEQTGKDSATLGVDTLEEGAS